MYEIKKQSQIKVKYIFGQTINYKGEMRKINGIRFTCDGVMYKLRGISEWIREEEI